MTTEDFEKKQKEMPTAKLIDLAYKEIDKLSESVGKSIEMSVPPKITDTDMVLCEVVRRFKDNQ